MTKKIKQNENYLKVHFNLFQISELSLYQIMVLNLLVSYDENNDNDITLTNNAIAKHFKYKIAKKSVDTFIPILEEHGYITKRMIDVWSEYSNRYDSKRLIEITPKTYAIINEEELPIEEDLPVSDSKKHSMPLETPKEPEAKSISTPIEDDVDSSGSLQFGQIEVAQEIPDVVITEEKLKWLNKKSNNDLSIDDMKELSQNVVNTLCYGDSGIWKIDSVNSENRFLIRLYYQGGSMCKLMNHNIENDFMRVNYYDLLYLLEKKGKDFSELTPKLYNHIKSYGLEKKPLNNNKTGAAA